MITAQEIRDNIEKAKKNDKERHENKVRKARESNLFQEYVDRNERLLRVAAIDSFVTNKHYAQLALPFPSDCHSEFSGFCYEHFKDAMIWYLVNLGYYIRDITAITGKTLENDKEDIRVYWFSDLYKQDAPKATVV